MDHKITLRIALSIQKHFIDEEKIHYTKKRFFLTDNTRQAIQKNAIKLS